MTGDELTQELFDFTRGNSSLCNGVFKKCIG